MFGTKIKSWMEAHIARSRAKKKERAAAGKVPALQARGPDAAPAAVQARHPPFWSSAAAAEEACPLFDAKFFLPNAADHDFNETLPALPISSSSFRGREKSQHYVQQQKHPQQQQQQQPAQQQGPYKSSAVNLSSPESAYSTGYSTDGTSPCATYAPEYYIKVRPANPAAASPARQQHQQQQQQQQQVEVPRIQVTEEKCWRKPTPPKSTRPPMSSPAKSGQLARKPYSTSFVGSDSRTAGNYPLQLFSPRRMPPLLTTTSTQVTPVKTSRSRQRPHRPIRTYAPSSHTNNLHQDYYCSRQESLSVGRSPVNRSEWRRGFAVKQRLRSSSASSCSSRSSRSCSVSSSSSNSNRNADGKRSAVGLSTSCSLGSSSSSSNSSSEQDLTLNELMGKFDDSYLGNGDASKESELASNSNGYSSSVNLSSEASANSSLERTSTTTARQSSLRMHPRKRNSRQRRGQLESKELLQLSKPSSSSAETNRALLERLLMKKTPPRRSLMAKPMWGAAMSSTSRSLGGTPICLRRKNQMLQSSVPTAPDSSIAATKTYQRRAYPEMESNCASSLNNISASELALLEADKEADLKYAQLIMEAERMLINVQQQLQRDESASNSRRGSTTSVATADSSPSRFPRRPYLQACQQQSTTRTASAPNKRVELIKNAELNIELALLKSRNSQPELSSGSIKDLLDHSSPKRLLQQQQKKTIEPAVAYTQTMISTLQTGSNFFPAFQSIDVRPVATAQTSQSDEKELSAVSEHFACPQSEPVKRKVYEDQHQQENSRLLQHQAPPWLRNSDGDCTAPDLQVQHQQLQSASASSSYSQLRKHMLIETLQGLKQSLEDQSASLKLNCLRPI